MSMARNHEALGRAFESTAMLHPQRPAIRLAPGVDVTYAELSALSNQIAGFLMTRLRTTGGVIALQNTKTPEGYAAMLACLKVGVAYTNLDPQNPARRLVHILSVCRPEFVLCDSEPTGSVAEAAGQLSIPLIDLRECLPEIRALDGAWPETDAVAGSDPAYVMFTSGSTGIPKGAVISHASVLNFIDWSKREFSIGPDAVVAGANPIYFDNSVFDFYSALFTGACLAPLAPEQLGDARGTVRLVDELGCTIWFSVPSLLIYLMTMRSLRRDTFTSVRAIIFGGEGYPKGELAKLFGLYGDRCRFVNVYGPTECTCICSAHQVTEDDLGDVRGLPPLGKIAQNFSFTILDGDKVVAPGEAGELCLLGPQLAIGYYNEPERTQASFMPCPAEQWLGERMYRTGDLVREAEDGLLHFVGRKDNQIKHMGYRIELEEIEVALNALGYVSQAAVTYKRIREGFGHIIAHIATGDPAIDGNRLTADLKDSLPAYMVPNRFVISAALPKNANGKVDRARLSDT